MVPALSAIVLVVVPRPRLVTVQRPGSQNGRLYSTRVLSKHPRSHRQGTEQHKYRGRGRVCEALIALSAFRGLGALGQTLDDRPCTDSVAFEPTLLDHQGVGNGVRKARDWCFVIRLHRADLDDFAVRLDKRDREWDRGIFHPERNALRRRKDKKHAGVFSKRLPEA